MSGIIPVVTLIGVFSVVIGMALGWSLRRANTWCPRCGGDLTCQACSEAPTGLYGSNQRWFVAPVSQERARRRTARRTGFDRLRNNDRR